MTEQACKMHNRRVPPFVVLQSSHLIIHSTNSSLTGDTGYRREDRCYLRWISHMDYLMSTAGKLLLSVFSSPALLYSGGKSAR